jgi:hypothetical protein
MESTVDLFFTGTESINQKGGVMERFVFGEIQKIRRSCDSFSSFNSTRKASGYPICSMVNSS